MNIENMEWPLSKEELEYLYWDRKMTQKNRRMIWINIFHCQETK